MSARFALAPAIVLCGAWLLAAEGDRRITVLPSKSTPAIESVTVFETRDGKQKRVGELVAFDKTLALPNDGPFEVYAKPKDGLAVKVVEKLTVKPGQTYEIKLGDLLGSVEVFGDNFPRADKLVLTDERDPGPDEKGHVAIQSAKDYRIEMAAPPGFYAVWVVPANGARAQRIADRIRVQASRKTRVGD